MPERALVAVAVLAITVTPAMAQQPGLPGDGVVVGQLIAEGSGEALAGEPVTLLWIPPRPASDYPYPWEPLGLGKVQTVAHTQTDEQGTFRFDDLGGGQYRIRIDLPRTGPDPEITLVPGRATQVVIEASLGRHVRGIVLRPDGSPASGADVFVAGREDGSGGNAVYGQEISPRPASSNGAFLLAGLTGEPHWIEAYHEDHGFSAPVRLVPQEEGPGQVLTLRQETERLTSLDDISYGGIGVSVGSSPLGPIVSAVTPGRPAARAGIQQGDRIVAVDGLETRWMPFVEFLMRCRGSAGQPVRQTLERGEHRWEVEVVRELLE